MKVVDYMIACRGGVKLRLQRNSAFDEYMHAHAAGGATAITVNPPTCKSECPRTSWPWSQWAVRSLRSHTAWSPPGSSPGCWRVSHLKEEEAGRVFTMETSFYNEALVDVWVSLSGTFPHTKIHNTLYTAPRKNINAGFISPLCIILCFSRR